jgi:hypothetical protein
MKMMETAVKTAPKQAQKPSPPAPAAPAQARQQASLSDPNAKLSSSEEDAVRRAIAPCWNIDPGVMNYKALQVHLRMVMNPDGTVREVTIVDSGRYGQDSYYRAAADAARRAVLNPRCNKLPLPPEKYANWQITNLIFDPKDILQ